MRLPYFSQFAFSLRLNMGLLVRHYNNTMDWAKKDISGHALTEYKLQGVQYVNQINELLKKSEDQLLEEKLHAASWLVSKFIEHNQELVPIIKKNIQDKIDKKVLGHTIKINKNKCAVEIYVYLGTDKKEVVSCTLIDLSVLEEYKNRQFVQQEITWGTIHSYFDWLDEQQKNKTVTPWQKETEDKMYEW